MTNTPVPFDLGDQIWHGSSYRERNVFVVDHTPPKGRDQQPVL